MNIACDVFLVKKMSLFMLSIMFQSKTAGTLSVLLLLTCNRLKKA